MRRRLPHRIPRIILVAVRADQPVQDRARGIHAETTRGEVVVIGVDEYLERIGLDGIVAARQARLDLPRLPVEQPSPHDQRLAVHEHAHFRALGDRPPFLRIELREHGLRFGTGPGRLR